MKFELVDSKIKLTQLSVTAAMDYRGSTQIEMTFMGLYDSYRDHSGLVLRELSCTLDVYDEDVLKQLRNFNKKFQVYIIIPEN